MKPVSSMSNTAHLTYGYTVLVALVFALSGCTAPHYAGRPAPVYFPLYGSSARHPYQHASIDYGPARPEAAASRDRSGKAETLRARQRLAEQNKTARWHERQQRGGEGTGWIDPAP
jgi:hypothetical protein